MKSLIQIFSIEFLVVCFVVAPIFGCAYTLTDCNKLTGTEEYSECLASNGVQDAQFEMGLKEFSDGNTEEAIEWLRRASKKRYETSPVFKSSGSDGDFTVMSERTGAYSLGHKEAQLLLVEIYERGLGVEVNQKAVDYY